VTPGDISTLNWTKGNGLLPVIVQHARTGSVLMTGYVNREALTLMEERHEVVLWSRTRQCLWFKGETSGNRIAVERIVPDCDRDALLVLGRPSGPACHTGASSCFAAAEPETSRLDFLMALEQVVSDRLTAPTTGSYITKLAAGGIRRLAQKVGEEGLEVALAASAPEEELISESADLLFHLIVLLKSRSLSLANVAHALALRHAEHRREPPEAKPCA